ncbi:hypothetical protein AB6A40_002904 [Gnathostoma spinigerum]|uniref:3-hydroxyisobutyryl-CoA hydrolase, mitochondrial n=1 Tax=Gnathostoma spinigerum TaxID=75299 RepID=A0ABD6E949_9BILA
MLSNSMFYRRIIGCAVLKQQRFASISSDVGIDIASEGSKRIIILNRPKALNALNLPMVRYLYPVLKEWNNDEKVSMVIIKGAGSKAFCAGGDVVAVTKSARARDPSQTVHKNFFREEYTLNHLIGRLSKPFVALIDGVTMGGGCGLSVHGPFRIATERTVLAMPETALGLFPDVGGSYFLPRLPHNLGMFLALTGHRLLGADVFHAGLATHYVPSDHLDNLEKELIHIPNADVNDNSIRSVLNKYHFKALPPFSLSSDLKEIEALFDGESIENIFTKLKNNGGKFASEQLRLLSRMSPTSMKITFRQLKNGARMRFDEVFTMEYRMSQRCMDGNDFHEGCRAVLIDKDRNPKWIPSTLEEVTEDMVNSYFAPLPDGCDLFLH